MIAWHGTTPHQCAAALRAVNARGAVFRPGDGAGYWATLPGIAHEYHGTTRGAAALKLYRGEIDPRRHPTLCRDLQHGRPITTTD